MKTVAELRAEFRASLSNPMRDSNEEFARWLVERINALERQIYKWENWHPDNETLAELQKQAVGRDGEYKNSLAANAVYIGALEERMRSFQSLASLVRTYITASGMRKTKPETAIVAMLELAREIAPKKGE